MKHIHKLQYISLIAYVIALWLLLFCYNSFVIALLLLLFCYCSFVIAVIIMLLLWLFLFFIAIVYYCYYYCYSFIILLLPLRIHKFLNLFLNNNCFNVLGATQSQNLHCHNIKKPNHSYYSMVRLFM